jgi:hypothetical protein
MSAPIRSAAAFTNARIAATESTQSTINSAVGLTTSGAYVASSSTPYISTAGTVKSAVEVVATKLRTIETTYAPTAYVDQKVSDLVNSAPAILDTLGEIATSLGNDPNLATTLVSTIGGEAARATAAEQGLSTGLASEIGRAVAAEETLSTIVASESAYARTQEQSLSTIIASETARAIAQEHYLSTTITSEIQRALTVDENFSTIFTQEVIRATGVEQSLSTAIVTEQIRATGAEQALSTNLATETLRATTAEQAISTAVVAETSRATGAETTLTQNLSTVQGTYINKDGSVKMTGNLDMSGGRITNVSSSPASNSDAITLGFYTNNRTVNYVGTLSVSALLLSNRPNPTSLDAINVAPGSMYRVMGQTTNQNTGCVIHTVTTATAAVTANSAGQYHRINFPSLTSTNIFSDGGIIDLSANNTDGSGSTVINPYDLTTSGNDLRAKYPGFSLFRVPLTATSRYYIFNDASTGNLMSARMDPGDIFESTGGSGPNAAYFRVIYRAPIDAAAGGTFNFDFMNRPNYANYPFGNTFYVQFTSAGTITAAFRKITVVKNSDFVIRSNTGTQWDFIDTSDPNVQGTIGRIQVRGSGPNITDFQVDIAPDYAGQASINTLGTVNIGTWNAAPIGQNKGGTGYTSYSSGDIIYANNVGMLQKRALGSVNQVLKVSTISGVALPVWDNNDTNSVTMTTAINGTTNLQTTLVNLSTSVAAETSRATTAEETLSTTIVNQISSIISAAPQALDTLKEIATALGDDPNLANTLISTIGAETARATGAEQGISTIVAGEIARAVSTEQGLSTIVAGEIARATAAEEGLSTSIVQTISSLTAETTRATAAEDGLSTIIAAEVARATSAEQGLSTSITAEITRAQLAEQGLSTSIVQTISSLTAETTRATGAETGLDGRLDTVESYLSTGTEGQVLKYVSGVPTFATNNTAGVSLSDATNFSTLTTVQGALDYLFNFTQTRKIIQHVVTSSTDYSSPTVPNSNFSTGKVHFINYNAGNLDIHLPPAGTYPDGTVYRLVHNGTYEDSNYNIKFYDAATSTATTIFELAPRDTISFIWDADSSSYLFGVGL